MKVVVQHNATDTYVRNFPSLKAVSAWVAEHADGFVVEVLRVVDSRMWLLCTMRKDHGKVVRSNV